MRRSSPWSPLSRRSAPPIGKPKFDFVSKEVPHELLDEILDEFGDQFKFALDTDDKNVREANLLPIKDAIHAKYDETYAETEPG